jgi:hypothetical protein
MFDVVRALYICFFRYGTSPIRTEYTMSDRRNQIMHRQVGHTEIWVNRTSPSTIEVVVYDGIDKTEKVTAVTTLDHAYDVVSPAIARELRRQQGETL